MKKNKTGEIIANDQHISFYVNTTIYVDDCVLPFVSWDQVMLGQPIVQSIFSKLGMEVHVGKEEVVIDESTGEPNVVLS